MLRSSSGLQVRRNRFSSDTNIDPDRFVFSGNRGSRVSPVLTSPSFRSTSIEVEENTTSANASPRNLITEIRYEIAGSGAGFHRQQRVGNWRMEWEASGDGRFQLRNLQVPISTFASLRVCPTGSIAIAATELLMT